MKTQESLSKSAEAALKQALKSTESTHLLLLRIKNGADPDVVITSIRLSLAELNQRVHEFNAYHNALTTD